MDFIQNNCGKIAFASILPTVAEEALATHNHSVQKSTVAGKKEKKKRRQMYQIFSLYY